MTSKNFKIKNGLDIGDVANVITVSNGVATITGTVSSEGSSLGNIRIGVTTDNELDTSTGNLTIDSAGGTTIIDDILQIGSGATVSTILDEDAMGSDSATALATQQSIKAYVDAQDANIASDTLTFTNKTFDANGTGNSISNIETADFASAAFKDEDNMASDSATAVASQQSIKAYVDSSIGALSSSGVTGQNVRVGVTAAGEIDTSSGNLTIDSAGGTVTVDDNLSVSGNATITGNLTVNGTTTTVATTNTVVSDTLIELGNGTTGAPANDAGIVIERGDSNNAFIGFDESADKFIVGTGTFTGASTGNLTISTGTLVANVEGNLTGTATAAQYSDLAERFAADTVYEPGTVVALGGAEEITATQEERSERVFGVVSGEHQAAFKMNGAAGTNETHPYIAMAGRVQVKVLGPISKGDRLVTSIVPGVARRAEADECTAFNVIGRALENKHTDGLGEVLCFVTAKS